MKEEPAVNKEIEESMSLASFGYEDAARRFFEAFLSGPLFVPERYQERPIANLPEYENDFVNVLGLQDGSRVIVPVFTDPSYIETWCGNPLSYKSVNGQKLFEMLPEEWWISVNPGSEIEKEISPWEVDLLRGGTSGIDAILAELFPREVTELLEVRPVRENEQRDLKLELAQFAASHPEIARLYMLIEIGRDIDEEDVVTLLLGVQAEIRASDEADSLREEIKGMAERALIGSGEAVRVMIGTSIEDNLMLGMFRKEKPFYERQTPPDPIGRFKMFIQALKGK